MQFLGKIVDHLVLVVAFYCDRNILFAGITVYKFFFLIHKGIRLSYGHTSVILVLIIFHLVKLITVTTYIHSHYKLLVAVNLPVISCISYVRIYDLFYFLSFL